LKDEPNELSKNYLYHKSEPGYFVFGSDAITHSYRNHKKKMKSISVLEIKYGLKQILSLKGLILRSISKILKSFMSNQKIRKFKDLLFL